MKKVNYFIKSFSQVALANIITKPLWLILFIYAARELGTEQFGIYTYAISVVIIASILLDFGFDYLAIREISKDTSKLGPFFNKIIFSRLLFFILILILFIFYAIAFNALYSHQFEAVMFVLLFQVSTIYLQFIKSIASALQHFKTYSKMIIFEKGLLVINGFIVLQFSNNLNNFLFVLVLTNLFNLLLFYLIIKKKYNLQIKPVQISLIVELVKESLPLLVMNIFIMAYFRIDVILLDSVINDKSIVGIYGTIHRIIEMYFLIPTILMSIAYPIISKNYAIEKDFVIKLVNKILFFLTAITLPIVIIVSFNSYAVNYFVFGADYKDGYRGLQYIIWAILPLGFNNVLGYLLISVNKQFYCALSVAIASAVNITLNLLLIPKYSLVGTSIAMLITEIIIFCLYGFFTLKFFGKVDIKNLLIKIFSIIVISLLSFLFLKNFTEYNHIIFILFFLVFSLVLISLFKIVKIEDLRSLFSKITDIRNSCELQRVSGKDEGLL